MTAKRYTAYKTACSASVAMTVADREGGVQAKLTDRWCSDEAGVSGFASLCLVWRRAVRM